MSIPVKRSPQNNVLVGRISRPLVVLTNENGSVSEVPDDVNWDDPLKPLFLYIGESKGEVQYYVIDNDIEVDSDLSGGKNDDTDNRGTASYRMGRPYSVPLGNKRVTIMRISLIKAD